MKKNYITLFTVSIENLKYLLDKKKLVLSIICSKCKNEDGKLLEEESMEILKVFGSIENI